MIYSKHLQKQQQQQQSPIKSGSTCTEIWLCTGSLHNMDDGQKIKPKKSPE